ncbi:MAG: hypothetical protein KC543_10075 [Myxococcales bacterium]|nr:hypothetical protein [Myxococcales bacterium]
MSESVEILRGGEVYRAIESAEVRLSLETLAPSWSIQYAADRSGDPQGPIEVEDRVTVRLGGEELLTGDVDRTTYAQDDRGWTETAEGRGLTSALVDCSSMLRPGRWQQIAVDALARALCDPFGVPVELHGDGGARFPRFAVQPGEAPGDALARAARLRGLLAYLRGDTLVFSRAGADRTGTVIRPGAGVSRFESTVDYARRMSEYHVRGQVRSTDAQHGKHATHVHYVSRDEGVRRHRPLIVHSSGEHVSLKRRAELEKNRRAGRSERVRVTLGSWRTAEGSLWRPNMLARVAHPRARIDAELLVVSAAYHADGKERSVTLELTRPESFDVGRYPARRR